MTESESIAPTMIPPSSRPTKLFLVSGLVIMIALAAFFIHQHFNKSNDIGYLTAAAVRGSITDAVQATGTIEPVERAELQFKNSGDVRSITLQPGDRVSKGQVLAEQDDTSLLAQVRQSEISVSQQEIQLQNLTLKKEQARKKLEQQQQLFDGGFISQSDLDDAKDGFTQAELDLSSAVAQLESIEARLEMDRSDLQSTRLTAPFAGIISAVDSQAGLSGGSSNSSSLMTLISEELLLNALVNEVDVGRVQAGQAVQFTSGAYPDRAFTGKVEKISPEASTVSNVNFYPVLITIDNRDGLLRSGMSVNANIIVASSQDVLTVPMMAISYAQSNARTGQAGGRAAAAATDSIAAKQPAAAADEPGRKMVFVLENDQAVQRIVKVGLDDSQNIEIVEGLKEGEKVIIGSSAGGSGANASGNNAAQTRNNGNRNNPGMGAPIMIQR